MLSFLYRMANMFEREHGFRPNVLYLNHQHFQQLKSQLANIRDLDALNQLLGMEIVLDSELTQPHVAWSSAEWHAAIAV
ncbi:MAG: hypothetical protein PVF81_08775 [Thioalkalispiraceae bacterium]